jgi:hypothetical protein
MGRVSIGGIRGSRYGQFGPFRASSRPKTKGRGRPGKSFVNYELKRLAKPRPVVISRCLYAHDCGRGRTCGSWFGACSSIYAYSFSSSCGRQLSACARRGSAGVGGRTRSCNSSSSSPRRTASPSGPTPRCRLRALDRCRAVRGPRRRLSGCARARSLGRRNTDPGARCLAGRSKGSSPVEGAGIAAMNARLPFECVVA